jgi:hypothetical protein
MGLKLLSQNYKDDSTSAHERKLRSWRTSVAWPVRELRCKGHVAQSFTPVLVLR